MIRYAWSFRAAFQHVPCGMDRTQMFLRTEDIMRIIADTASLFSPAEGRTMGLTVVPVSVVINDRTYRDYEEITSAAFLERIAAGGVPSSSQPSKRAFGRRCRLSSRRILNF